MQKLQSNARAELEIIHYKRKKIVILTSSWL